MPFCSEYQGGDYGSILRMRHTLKSADPEGSGGDSVGREGIQAFGEIRIVYCHKFQHIRRIEQIETKGLKP